MKMKKDRTVSVVVVVCLKKICIYDSGEKDIGQKKNTTCIN